MSPGSQNMKTVLDALVTAEIESGSAKYENGNQHLGTVRNEFGRAKNENGTRRPR
jgi:hypothetical protein